MKLDHSLRGIWMSDAPRSFWGKLALITAFLSALVGFGTRLNQCSQKDYNVPNYPSPTQSAVPTNPPLSNTPKIGCYCNVKHTCRQFVNRWESIFEFSKYCT